MPIRFNADEILAIAEKIEQNGSRFYLGAADKITETGPHDMLKELAQREKEHQKTFAMMREDLSGAEKEPTTFDPEDELALYLQSFANEKVFRPDADPLAALGSKPAYADILRTAIVMEKDSIALYVGIRDLVPERRGKSSVDAILKEEMTHLAQLSGELAQLRK